MSAAVIRVFDGSGDGADDTVAVAAADVTAVDSSAVAAAGDASVDAAGNAGADAAAVDDAPAANAAHAPAYSAERRTPRRHRRVVMKGTERFDADGVKLEAGDMRTREQQAADDDRRILGELPPHWGVFQERGR